MESEESGAKSRGERCESGKRPRFDARLTPPSPLPTSHSPYSGKVALVTGAGVRLGRALAIALAQSGCDMVLHYRHSRGPVINLAGEIAALGRRTKLLQADLSQAKEMEALARRAEKAFGHVDILINSAAIFRPTPLAQLNAREFDAFINVNLKAPYILSSWIGRRMKQRGAGVIINLACVSAQRPWATHVPYSISKAGVVALTAGLAKLLGPQVRVNAIAPGAVLPPSGTSLRRRRDLAERVPLKRLGSPDDVVRAALYLCTADFVTGQVLFVDGGQVVG